MNYNLSCHDFYEDENNYWFSEFNFNGFYKVNKQTLKSELIFQFPNEELNKRGLFHCIEKVGHWFIFAPTWASKILLYNEISKEIKEFELKEYTENRKIKYENMPKFLEVIKYENSVFFIPSTYPAIIKLDLNTMELQYIENWINSIENILKEERKPYLNMYFAWITVNDNTIVMPLGCSNHVLLFNMINNSSELIEVKTKAIAFNSVIFDGNDYWFMPRVGGCITKWNMNSKESSCIEIPIKEDEKEKGMFNQPIVYGNKLYISSTPNSSPYIINIKTGKIEKNTVIIENILNIKKKLSTFPAGDMLCVRLKGNKLQFINGRNFCWYFIDLDTEEVESFSIEADEVGKKTILEEIIKQDIFVAETSSQGITELCNYINEFTDMRNELIVEEEAPKETIGSAILKATTS